MATKRKTETSTVKGVETQFISDTEGYLCQTENGKTFKIHDLDDVPAVLEALDS